MPEAIRIGGAGVDLSQRLFRTATVAASPADATITAIASLTIPDDLAITEGVLLFGYAAYTVGTAGVSALFQMRRTGVAGTIIKASGLKTVAATELHDECIVGFDTGATLPGQVYVIAMTVTSASAASTVSAVELIALVV